MSKVIFTEGLPGSGKSTWAKAKAKNSGWKRVNRDELRLMLDFKQFDYKNEKFITKVEKELILSALDSGNSVIVDATNLNKDRVKEQKAIIKGYYPDVQFETKSFLDVSIEKCIENDLKRENSVGSKVIYDMWARYFDVREDLSYPKIVSDDLRSLYIFDLDGSLAKMDGRKPFMWDRVGEDLPRTDVMEVLESLRLSGNMIYIFSGRDSICQGETENWLKKHAVPYDGLFMRAEGDNRKDAIIKRELFDEHVVGKGFHVCGCFDDRPVMVREWKKMGLTVFNIDDRMYHTNF